MPHGMKGRGKACIKHQPPRLKQKKVVWHIRRWRHALDDLTFLIAARLSFNMRPGCRILRSAKLKSLPPAATALDSQKPFDRPANADAALPNDIQMTALMAVPSTHRAACPAVDLPRNHPTVSSQHSCNLSCYRPIVSMHRSGALACNGRHIICSMCTKKTLHSSPKRALHA